MGKASSKAGWRAPVGSHVPASLHHLLLVASQALLCVSQVLPKLCLGSQVAANMWLAGYCFRPLHVLLSWAWAKALSWA